MGYKISSARALVPACEDEVVLSHAEKNALLEQVKVLLDKQNAVLISHYYAEDWLQEITEKTGGFIGDSLEMARFGHEHSADTLVVSGVHFMGETAKILSPEKRVLVPDKEATCSLDLGCPIEDFAPFCDAHPDRTVVVYANTSAAVKARADWVVTSSIAVPLIEHLHAQGEKIIWAPDKHLGSYLQHKTGADLLLWDGACIVHEAFKSAALKQLKAQYPTAAVLVHPEAPAEVLSLADFIGSTSQMLRASQQLPNDTFIVGTERGILYKMRQASPHKLFVQVPSGGNAATCRSCAHCPWMKLNSVEKIIRVLQTGANEITLPASVIARARQPLQRMLDFAKTL